MSGVTYNCEGCGVPVHRQKGDEGRGRFCSIKCGRAHQPMKSREERFWAKVRKSDGCWEWTGARRSGNHKYGTLKTGPRGSGSPELAHRISWELHFGPVPAGLWVLHHCDNPPCVRPDHLHVGTPADNVVDRQGRDRHWTHSGDTHPQALLTVEKVQEIRRRRANGELLRVLAADFGVSVPLIGNIVKRRAWKHVP